MSNRLEFISQQIRKTQQVTSSFDYLNLETFLTKEQNEIRKHFRQFGEEHVTTKIDPYVEKAEFPQYIIPIMREKQLLKHFFSKPYGTGARTTAAGCYIAQLARADSGIATFVIVQVGLAGYTIQALGSEEQKKQYIPKLISLQKTGGWGLTEDKIGSDASSLVSSVDENGNGQYKINGTKRWIGNGNRDFLITWCRSNQTKKVNCFILDNSNLVSGQIKAQPIKYKLPMRIVQNCHIKINDVVVKEDSRLPKAVDFNDTNRVLKHSRVFVCWIGVGVAMGVYDNAIKYVTERKQFGRAISGFQLVQERMVKIMSTTQAMLLLIIRISQLVEQGKASIGQIAFAKAWISDRLREVAKWGREVCGGNGITHENYVMKAVADAEAIYTYEGTYDINSLVAGRQLTGFAAFKK